MNEDLKACPFCGKPAIYRDEVIFANGEKMPANVRCPDCHISIRPDKWNNRPIEDHLITEFVTKQKTPCIWRYDDIDSYYMTGCGKTWQFEDGITAEENGIHFCHNCGQPVLVAMPETDPDAEEE